MNPVRDAMHRSQLPGRLPAGTHGALAICKRKPDEAHINNVSLLFSSTLQRGAASNRVLRQPNALEAVFRTV